MKRIAIISLITGLTILIVYIILLTLNGYINLYAGFSLENASKLAPFIGSCVGIFFTLAGTFLVIENLKITNKNNYENQILTQKNQFENVFFNLLTQQRQIRDSIKSQVEFESEKHNTGETSGTNFFDDLCTRIVIDFDKTNMDLTSLNSTYKNWFTIHNSDLGHYFRHLYHIVKFVDRNPYFELVKDKLNFINNYDYLGILRAQLSNGELVLLGLNGLSTQGQKFYPYIEKYELLKNINLEEHLPDVYLRRVPKPKLIKENYKHLNK